MKEKVYQYFKNNAGSTVNKCAATLGIDGLKALREIHELEKEGYLMLRVLPLGNDIEPDCSDFYFARETK